MNQINKINDIFSVLSPQGYMDVSYMWNKIRHITFFNLIVLGIGKKDTLYEISEVIMNNAVIAYY